MNTLPSPAAGLLMSTPESTAPAAFDKAIIGSFTVRFSVLRVVVVPLTVRLPVMVTFDGNTGSVRFAFKSKLLHTNSFDVSRFDILEAFATRFDSRFVILKAFATKFDSRFVILKAFATRLELRFVILVEFAIRFDSRFVILRAFATRLELRFVILVEFATKLDSRFVILEALATKLDSRFVILVTFEVRSELRATPVNFVPSPK